MNSVQNTHTHTHTHTYIRKHKGKMYKIHKNYY